MMNSSTRAIMLIILIILTISIVLIVLTMSKTVIVLDKDKTAKKRLIGR